MNQFGAKEMGQVFDLGTLFDCRLPEVSHPGRTERPPPPCHPLFLTYECCPLVEPHRELWLADPSLITPRFVSLVDESFLTAST